ncbi:MAG TPA: STAS domain-containing protein [Pyrinomonadaceae bacterium]|jgi:anti-anti-sigma factor|nr:STAS domain-containing protein [Pyrinomonadaceae bacterium]
MEINPRTDGSVTILDLKGNLTIGASEEELTEMIAHLLSEGRKHLLLNLAEVPVIDSSGIGGLIKSFTRVKNGGGKLKLLHPSRNVRQLLSITGLLSVLEIFDDEATALLSF